MRPDYSDSPAQKILIDPIFSLGTDKLCILSSEANPSMASWLLTTYKERSIEGISTELILTSAAEQGVTETVHNGFKALHKAYYGEVSNTFTCSYLDETPEKKESLFIWMKDDIPVIAFTCSYNFTQNSLLQDGYGSISLCEAKTAYKIFQVAVGQSIYCVNSEVEDYIVIGPSYTPDVAALPSKDPNYIKLPLVTKKTGEPGKKSC